MILFYFILVAPPTYCNICLLQFICVDVSNGKIWNLFNVYSSFMDPLMVVGEETSL